MLSDAFFQQSTMAPHSPEKNVGGTTSVPTVILLNRFPRTDSKYINSLVVDQSKWENT